MKTRRAALLLAKVALTAALFWWLSRSIDLGRLHDTLALLSPANVAVAALAVVAQSIVIGWRWHRIVARLGGDLSPRKAVRWVFVGMFFNQVLPTSVGGDVVRVWSLHREGTARGVALASVAIERATGLVVLGGMISLCALFLGDRVAAPALRVALLAVGPSLLAGLVLATVTAGVVASWLPPRPGTALRDLAAALRRLAAAPAALLEVAFLGAVAALCGIAAAVVVGGDLGMHAGFAAYVAMVGGATLFGVLPVSLGGWGLREVGMVALFGSIGIAAEPVFALSVLWGLLPLAVSLPWGLAWWLGGAPAGAPDPLPR